MLRKFSEGLARDMRTTVVAVVASSLVLAAPAAAAVAYAVNADKVDNKHAVSSKATKTTRANKLVATSSTGYLPNNIIVKALDADKLDGLNSSVFARKANQPFAQSGTGADGVLSGVPAVLASTTVNAPAAGTVLLTGEATFNAGSSDSYLYALLSEGGSYLYSSYWDAGDADGYYDQRQTLTYAVPVTAGTHTFSLEVAEDTSGFPSGYGIAAVTATYLPGTVTAPSAASAAPVLPETQTPKTP